MNRLTIRNSDGSVSQPTDLRWDIALERLAAYEETGLTPEQIRRYKFLISDTGSAIKAMRKERGWTQEELGAHLGVTGVSVGRFESGVRKMSIRGLIRTAEVFEETKTVAANEQDAQEPSQRLAAYEDTGLTPDVCAEYKKFEDEAISKNVPFSRLVELMNADAEERVVVLPCKVGDTVWIVDCDSVDCDNCENLAYGKYCKYLDKPICPKGFVRRARFGYGHIPMVTKNVFFSYEEAETARKGEENGSADI